MIFNSIDFAVYLPIVFILYWFVLSKQLKAQNFLLLVSSYIFYGWWDYRFLSLIALSTVVDYFIGLKIHNEQKPKFRRNWMWLSVSFNLGILGFFKYYNFFVESFIDAFNLMGYELNSWTLSIILPVGISFYSFQTMSYTLDVYKKQLKPTKDFIAFAAFVSFFPQLVAGPIERASNLLPQLLKPRVFNYEQSVEGVKLMLWGFFKKIVIADSLAPAVADIFTNYTNYSAGTLALGAVYFAFQIYGDFSGYSNIARGVAKLLGIELMVNFNYPYFSRNIGEFWRRWHISLSTWFRDYLYIPLGGSRVSKSKALRNIFIIFLVSGFWHGANWTFIVWGAVHATLFIPSFILGNNRKYLDSSESKSSLLLKIKEFFLVLKTFGLVVFAWVFFRAENLSHAIDYLSHILYLSEGKSLWLTELIFVIVMLLGDVIKKNTSKTDFGLLGIVWDSILIYIIFCIFIGQNSSSFIYFQF